MGVDLAVFAVIGRNLYRRVDGPTDVLLDNRSARMIGTRVTICEAISVARAAPRMATASGRLGAPDMAVGAIAMVKMVEVC